MSVTLTILCDNSVAPRPGLIGEHGFSCHVATAGHQYLLDTGSGLGLLTNAATCGIDLSGLDAVLLSHGHWDHCGGLLHLLKLCTGRRLPIYAHPAIFDDKIFTDAGRERAIGAGFSRAEAEMAGADFQLSTSHRQLPGGLLFSGAVPRERSPEPDSNLCYRQADRLIPDPLLDDQSLYIQSDAGLVILCGCAHAGVRNILAHARSLTGIERLHALIGGLHHPFTVHEQGEQIIQDLLSLNVQQIALSHCTGHTAVNRFMNSFGSAVSIGRVGTSYIF